MERGQNYGITVLHPKESSTNGAANEDDIIFECVLTPRRILVKRADWRNQPSRHPWSGRRPIHDMDTRQRPAYVAARPFAPSHPKRQNHDLWL